MKTNTNGNAYFTFDTKGTFTLTYYFNVNGYAPIKQTKKVTVVPNTKSVISASNYVAYKGASNPFTVTLKAGGVPLPNQKVVFKYKGKTYSRTTNSKGQAVYDVHSGVGTNTISYSFKGVTYAKSVAGSAKITVKKGMPTQIIKANSITYQAGISAPLKITYKDVRGNLIPFKTIVLKVNSKTYTKKTDKNGAVTFTLKLNSGTHTIKLNSYNTDVYKSSSKSFTVKVKGELINNGFWLFGTDMYGVNLDTMAKNGVNHIFLNFYAVDFHGKEKVATFATKAKSLGINVHIWMQAFYNDGSWISPVSSDGSYKYSLFNSIINKAKEYAKIDGVSGIHFDYLRFPGTAYKHTNGVAAINYFTKQACTELHKLNSKLIVSAAVMPEPSMMKYYYGQDIPTLSKYLDAIVPMVYKGNYNQDANWVKSITSTFVSQSNGAQIWTGLQGYYSDNYVAKLPKSTLIKDAQYAGMGGATGVIVFRFNLFNLIDFNAL